MDYKHGNNPVPDSNKEPGNRQKPAIGNPTRNREQWLFSALIIGADRKNLTFAGLLAGETVFVVTTIIIALIVFIAGKGSITRRCVQSLQMMLPWFPVIAFQALLSAGVAHLAQWLEKRFHAGRGQLAVIVALVPVAPIVFAIYLTPGLFLLAPFLGMISLWALWQGWWGLFLFFLQRLTNWNYQKALAEALPGEKKPDSVSWHRYNLELRKAMLIERDERRQNAANAKSPGVTGMLPSPNPPGKGSVSGLSTAKRRILWCIMALVFTTGCLGLFLAIRHIIGPPQPKVTATSEPTSLSLWYQLDDAEEDIVLGLAQTYALDGTPVYGTNKPGDLPLLLRQAFLVGQGPDVMILPDELAGQLRALWHHIDTEFFFPLWPDRPWHKPLVLVVSPTTRHPDMARDFIDFLHRGLTKTF